MKTFYVVLERRWKDRAKRWSTAFYATADHPYRDANILAVWETKAANAHEATAIVAEWLHSGRSAAMSVHEIAMA